MEDRQITVTLIGPAKINGVREPVGKTVTISATLALQLAASGSIDPEIARALSESAAMPEMPLAVDFDAAVARRAEELASAVTSAAVEAAIADRIAEIRKEVAAERDAYWSAVITERDAHWSTAMDHFETMAEDDLAAAVETLKLPAAAATPKPAKPAKPTK